MFCILDYLTTSELVLFQGIATNIYNFVVPSYYKLAAKRGRKFAQFRTEGQNCITSLLLFQGCKEYYMNTNLEWKVVENKDLRKIVPSVLEGAPEELKNDVYLGKWDHLEEYHGLLQPFKFHEDWPKITHLSGTKYFITGGSHSRDGIYSIHNPLYSSKVFLLDSKLGII